MWSSDVATLVDDEEVIRTIRLLGEQVLPRVP